MKTLKKKLVRGGGFNLLTERLARFLRDSSEVFYHPKKKYLDEETAFAEAHRDWLAARDYFDYATDPDLVDYAIHSLKAAEKRYIYLWKRARRRGGWADK